jgi:hypothetical protein
MPEMRTAAIGTLAGLALFVAACGGGDESSERAGSCGPVPTALTPTGSGQDAFTMGIRVNQIPDIEGISAELRDYVLDRDVFVINTEYPQTSPRRQEILVERVKAEFPCNRIATLNGLGGNPEKPSYQFALAGHPDVDAIMVDWEQISYEAAGRGRWSPSEGANLPRIARQLNQLGGKLKGTEVRMGLVPQYLPPWDYGRTARTLAIANLAIDSQHFGFQIVQTQTNCGRPVAPGPLIGPLSRDLIREYRALIGTKVGDGTPLTSFMLQHLGFEIAFSEDPEPGSTEALARIGPKQAAACSREILNAGGAGILYWATPEALAAMLETRVGKMLRPRSSS